jgi:hypothetical protein
MYGTYVGMEGKGARTNYCRGFVSSSVGVWVRVGWLPITHLLFSLVSYLPCLRKKKKKGFLVEEKPKTSPELEEGVEDEARYLLALEPDHVLCTLCPNSSLVAPRVTDTDHYRGGCPVFEPLIRRWWLR